MSTITVKTNDVRFPVANDLYGLFFEDINRSGDEEIMNRWQSKNGVTITKKEDMDIDSFKKAVEGVDEWFVEQLKDAGYDDGQELVDLFEK